MLDPKRISEMEQAQTAIVEFYPPLWRGLYIALTAQGFSESQAFALLRTYIRTTLHPTNDA